MNTMTLSAHFDGKQVQFDQPVKLAPNTKLIVTVLPSDEKAAWELLSLMGFQAAYGENEPEYPATLIKEANSEYAGR